MAFRISGRRHSGWEVPNGCGWWYSRKAHGHSNPFATRGVKVCRAASIENSCGALFVRSRDCSEVNIDLALGSVVPDGAACDEGGPGRLLKE